MIPKALEKLSRKLKGINEEFMKTLESLDALVSWKTGFLFTPKTAFYFYLSTLAISNVALHNPFNVLVFKSPGLHQEFPIPSVGGV